MQLSDKIGCYATTALTRVENLEFSQLPNGVKVGERREFVNSAEMSKDENKNHRKCWTTLLNLKLEGGKSGNEENY